MGLAGGDEPPVLRLADRVVPVVLRRMKRARSIVVTPDPVAGHVRVTLPPGVGERRALRFVAAKTDWIAARFAAAPPRVALVPGATVGWEGEPHRIEWSEALPRAPERAGGAIRSGGPEELVPKRLLGWMRREARALFAADLARYCAAAGEAVPALSVGDARRRWGSCSHRRSGGASIRLNWRLAMAPSHVRRSVVAHEVAHLAHMNHSPAFYAHLDAIYGADRARADGWLKAHGAGLHLVGA